MKVSQMTFVVTGGASGLGKACVEMLRDLGANVGIFDLNEELGNALAKTKSSLVFKKVNIADEVSVKEGLKAVTEKFSTVHGLINCAGVGTPEKVIGKEAIHRLESFKKIIDINLCGTFNLIRLCAEIMVKNNPNEEKERGVIINTASVAAYDGQVGQAAYSASKGGVVAMTLPIARELASFGIRIMTIAPGIFDTPMLAGLPEKAKESLGLQVPFPSRLGKPSEYAKLCQQIIENPMLNGEVIRLDGALRMAPR